MGPLARGAVLHRHRARSAARHLAERRADGAQDRCEATAVGLTRTSGHWRDPVPHPRTRLAGRDPRVWCRRAHDRHGAVQRSPVRPRSRAGHRGQAGPRTRALIVRRPCRSDPVSQ